MIKLRFFGNVVGLYYKLSDFFSETKRSPFKNKGIFLQK